MITLQKQIVLLSTFYLGGRVKTAIQKPATQIQVIIF